MKQSSGQPDNYGQNDKQGEDHAKTSAANLPGQAPIYCHFTSLPSLSLFDLPEVVIFNIKRAVGSSA
jgi:hypothetical protein